MHLKFVVLHVGHAILQILSHPAGCPVAAVHGVAAAEWQDADAQGGGSAGVRPLPLAQSADHRSGRRDQDVAGDRLWSKPAAHPTTFTGLAESLAVSVSVSVLDPLVT